MAGFIRLKAGNLEPKQVRVKCEDCKRYFTGMFSPLSIKQDEGKCDKHNLPVIPKYCIPCFLTRSMDTHFRTIENGEQSKRDP